MSAHPTTIGFYGISRQDILHRSLSGILHYTQGAGEFLLRDFRIPNTGRSNLPPWRGRVDGVVTAIGRMLGETDKETADWILSGRVPAVSIAADWQDPRIPSFRTQSRSLGKLAANHLVKCGCLSFLYVGFSASSGSLKREQALARSLAQKGLKLVSYATDYGLYGSPTDADLVFRDKKLSRLLRTLKKPLGVWALNDNFARGVCLLCTHLGLAIPADVKVLGVDDLAIARAQRPSLSSIRTPGEEIGFRAMQALHALLNEERGVRRPQEIPATELVVRASTVGGVRENTDYQEAVTYIARHACSGITVEHLAERLDVSLRSFELQFQAQIGHTPREEIQKVRLERARELLWQTQLSIRSIASMMGYGETAPFTRFFRRETGLSPIEYREGARR